MTKASALALAALTLFGLGCGGSAGRGGAGSGAAALAPGDHELDLDFGGRERYYLVRVPPAARNGESLPLVLAFHGGGGNPDQFKEGADLDRVADREGFLAVYPAGTGRLPRTLLTWNAGACCGSAAAEGVDDVGFVRALIDDLAARAPVDRTRVYAIGHSNGAMMAYRLAVEAPDRIAAIVPVGGAMSLLGPPRPERPVPLLHIHSVDDPRALYQGGTGPPFPLTNSRVDHRPVEESLAFWRAANGCEGEPEVVESREGAEGTRNAGQSAEHLVWWPCSSGAPVEHWRMAGVGHGWPGELQPRLRERVVGPSTTLVDASEEAWRFLRRFPVRGSGPIDRDPASDPDP